MKNSLIILFGLIFISCETTQTGMSNEEFLNKVDSIENVNISEGVLANGWYETSQTENNFERINVKDTVKFFINPKPVVLTDNFNKSEEFVNNQGVKGLEIILDQVGSESWSIATKNNIGKHLIFILDNKILTAPIVNSQITGGATAFWKDDLSDKQWNKLKELTE